MRQPLPDRAARGASAFTAFRTSLQVNARYDSGIRVVSNRDTQGCPGFMSPVLPGGRGAVIAFLDDAIAAHGWLKQMLVAPLAMLRALTLSFPYVVTFDGGSHSS